MAQRRASNKKNTVKQSKKLTYALRHGAEKLKLNMSPDGFVAVSELLSLRQFRGLSLELIQSIAANCPKQRFGLKEEDGRWFVRANQGHTTKRVKSSELLTPITSAAEIPNGTCIHGTYRRYLRQIKATGLSRMKRNNIHFTPHLVSDPKQPHSGFRASCDTLIYLNVEAVLAAGIKLYISSNGVVLSPGNKDGFIPPQFFAKIVDRRTLESVASIVPAAAPPLPTAKAGSASVFLSQEQARFQKSDILALKLDHEQANAVAKYLTGFTKRLRGALTTLPESVKIKINKTYREVVRWDVVTNKPLSTERPLVADDVQRLLSRLATEV